MPEPRNIIRLFSGIFPSEWLLKHSRVKLIFPFYHAISEDPPPHLRQLYKIKSTESFRKDLDFLLRNYVPLSPSVLLVPGQAQSIEKPSFILSFDDGLREVRDIIVPVLREYGLSAVFFINNDFISNRDLFFRYKASLLSDTLLSEDFHTGRLMEICQKSGLQFINKHKLIKGILHTGYRDKEVIDRLAFHSGLDFNKYLFEEKPYLGESEIHKLIEEGFFIGAHSFDHPWFSELNSEEQKYQLFESMTDIQNRFNLNYRFFAFPFTDHGFDSSLLSKDGKPFDGIFGTAGMKTGKYPNYFQRMAMEKQDAGAESIIKTEYIYYKLKKLAGK